VAPGLLHPPLHDAAVRATAGLRDDYHRTSFGAVYDGLIAVDTRVRST